MNEDIFVYLQIIIKAKIPLKQFRVTVVITNCFLFIVILTTYSLNIKQMMY